MKVKVKNTRIYDLISEKLGYEIEDGKLIIDAEVTADTYTILNSKGQTALEADFTMDIEDIEGYEVLKDKTLKWKIDKSIYEYKTQLADFEMPQTYLVNVLLNRIFKVSRSRGTSVSSEQRAKLLEERAKYKAAKAAMKEDLGE